MTIRRFTLKNAYIASIAPLQLYCSGLAFSLMQSTLTKVFTDDVLKRMCTLPNEEDLWGLSLQTLEAHSRSVEPVLEVRRIIESEE